MAAAIAAGVGALGDLAGGLIGKKKPKVDFDKITNRDPLMNALSLETLLALGVPIDQALIEQASPLGRRSGSKVGRQLINLVNAGQEAGLSLDEILASIEGDKLVASKQKRLDKLLAKSGYSSLRDLVSADLAFSDAAEARAGELAGLSPVIRQGRDDALRKIAEVQSGFIAPSEEQLTARTKEIEDILRAQIARDFGERGKAALYEANALGINPAARLGRLDEGRALAELAAGPDALARTLQLLGGQQGLQTNALAALQGSLQPATTNASNLLTQRLNQNSQAANQALALAGLQSQGNQLLGQGVGSAISGIGSIPLLIQETNRQRQLDELFRNLIDPRTGIGTPPING